MKTLHALEIFAVDVGFVELEAVDGIQSQGHVARVDGGGQAVLAVIGQSDGFIEIAEGQHGQHRPEDFLAHDFHILAAIAQQRGHVEIALLSVRRRAARDRLRPVGPGPADHAFDFGQLLGVDLAAHVRRGFVKRIAQTHGFKSFDQLFREGAGNALVHIDPLRAVADLAAEDRARGRDGFGCQIQIRVRADDGRSLAAQFERNLGDVGRAGRDDALPGLHAAGEGNHVGERAFGQGFAQARPTAGDHVQHALGQVQPGGDFGEFHDRDQSHAAGLDHHGAPGQQGRCHLAGRDKEREIPGTDARHHADRLTVEQDIFTRAVTLDDFAFIDPRPTGVIVEIFGGEIHLHLRQGQGFGLLPGQDDGQFRAPLADAPGQLFQRRGARAPAARPNRPARPARPPRRRQALGP